MPGTFPFDSYNTPSNEEHFFFFFLWIRSQIQRGSGICPRSHHSGQSPGSHLGLSWSPGEPQDRLRGLGESSSLYTVAVRWGTQSCRPSRWLICAQPGPDTGTWEGSGAKRQGRLGTCSANTWPPVLAASPRAALWLAGLWCHLVRASLAEYRRSRESCVSLESIMRWLPPCEECIWGDLWERSGCMTEGLRGGHVCGGWVTEQGSGGSYGVWGSGASPCLSLARRGWRVGCGSRGCREGKLYTSQPAGVQSPRPWRFLAAGTVEYILGSEAGALG